MKFRLKFLIDNHYKTIYGPVSNVCSSIRVSRVRDRSELCVLPSG